MNAVLQTIQTAKRLSIHAKLDGSYLITFGSLKKGAVFSWPGGTSDIESLHSALARNGWKRVRPYDGGDCLAGEYQRHA